MSVCSIPVSVSVVVSLSPSGGQNFSLKHDGLSSGGVKTEGGFPLGLVGGQALEAG